jgi:class 3 adenylate cyclase
VPGIAGPNFAQRAVEAAERLLEVTGYGSPEGPWIELGAGVHTGIAYVGAVGSDGGVGAVTVLGEAANTTARLASAAASGEVLVSQNTIRHAGLESEGLEARSLELKGVAAPVDVRVLRRHSVAAGGDRDVV